MIFKNVNYYITCSVHQMNEESVHLLDINNFILKTLSDSTVSLKMCKNTDSLDIGVDYNL